ncbi:MAG: type IV secretory system conjugative DNA transfer family protein [Solirubrobacteraceae bacterium]
MSRANLAWFRLRFPRELDESAAIAALSACAGLPHPSRLIFCLSATEAGIEHRLAVTKGAVETVSGSLRAAIPSLHLDTINPPLRAYTRRELWQLIPATAAIRVDSLAAIVASLLASLYPLHTDEHVELCWTARPAMRPRVDLTGEAPRQGRALALRRKLASPGLAVRGELRADAATSARATQLLRRTGSILRSLSTPHGRLIADAYWYGQLLYLLGLRGRFLSAPELAAVIGWPIDAPDLPGLELGVSRRLVPSGVLPTTGRTLGLSNLAGITRPVAITPTASTRGLYILGPTGTGKTNLIKHLVSDDLHAGRGLAVIETNGDLVKELCDLIPPERVNDVVLLDPTDRRYAVGFNPFANTSDPSLVADHIGELFQRLWSAYWGPRTAQLAHMGLLTLARRPGSTLLDLPRLFLDESFRASVLADLDDPVGLAPDWHWFARLPEREQATVIAPLLNKVRQFTARASIRAIVGQAKPMISLHQIMADNKVLLVHIPKGLIGQETAQLLGCLVLTSLWQATAQRAALAPGQRAPFGLYVDEVQDFAASPVPWEEKFAQGRKYGLALTVAHQNLGQLPRELREVVLANARSKAVFALSASDAKALEPLFAPSLTAADLQALDAYSVAAIVALDNGSIARPVTLTTPPPPMPCGPGRQAVRDASRRHYARASAEVEAALRRQVARARPPAAPVGRKPRSSR